MHADPAHGHAPSFLSTHDMDTPIDVPQDGNLIDDNPFSEQPTVTTGTSRSIHVHRRVYVLASPGENDEEPRGNRRPHTHEVQQERQAVVLVRRRRQYLKKPSRWCYCFLLVPFLLALAALILGITTFTIKNEEMKRKCSNITCTLSCGESVQEGCWIVIGGGAGLCLGTLLYILLLLIRLCSGSKMYCCCVLMELLLLFVLFGGSVLVGAFLSIGIETDTSCLDKALGWCEVEVDIHDLIDFMRQSEISVWIGSICFMFAVGVWIIMALSFVPKRTEEETVPLIAN